MNIYSKQFLLDNKHLSVEQLLNKIEEDERITEENLKEILKVNTKEEFIVNSTINIPFLNLQTKEYSSKEMTITNEKTVATNQFNSDIWYQLNNEIWVSRLFLNLSQYHMKKNDLPNALNSLLKCYPKFNLHTIEEMIDPNNEIHPSKKMELGICPTFIFNPYDSRELISMAKTINKNYFYSDFNLTEYIQLMKNNLLSQQ